MSQKRVLYSLSMENAKRRKSGDPSSYYQRALQECGLVVKKPPEKCEALKEIVYIVRDLKKSLNQHTDYPHNVDIFLSEFKSECNNKEIFEHYLFLNIVRKTQDQTYNVDNSIIKLLLNIPFLQTELISYIFDKVMDSFNEPLFNSWVKMILKSLSNLDRIEHPDELSSKLIDLLEISTDKFVRLEIISAIPDIIGDSEHDNVASEMSRILSHDRYLIPSILDCLTYLCLSDTQFERLQKETLNLLQPSNAAYFSNFVKFLLTPGRLTDSAYEETIKSLRKELGWPSIGSEEDIATSQILTAKEIRNYMLSSKNVAKIWLKVVSSCASHTEHKPIDIVFFLIIASLSDEKHKQVENVMRKQIKLQILKEDLFDQAFQTFKPILKKNVMIMISLANSLLKPGSEPLVESYGAHMHMTMFSELTECSAIIVSELLQLVLNCKNSALNALNILNNIASANSTLIKRQSSQMMILLDKLDDMSLTEKKAVMNLVCRLAYSFENSDIRDELHIIIRKELGSSISSIKKQGILAGIHAVKYLMKSTFQDVEIQEDVTLNMTSCLPPGDLREAAQIIELIHHSTTQFPDMIAFFCDELFTIINRADDINNNFLSWLTFALTNYWQENFLVEEIEKETINGVRLSMQYRLNHDSEVECDLAVNVAGLTLEDSKEINIEVLSSLFQLVRILHYKKESGNLSAIDVLLGCPIVMPIVDTDSITDLSEAFIKKILDCYIICVNWIREILNAFASQEEEFLKPKIINRISQLKELEQTIDTLNRKMMNSEHADIGTKSQQTQTTQIAKTKIAHNLNLYMRPLDLSLIQIIQYDLTPLNASENELTFEILTYLLSYINMSLEKVLVSRIKKNPFLNKDAKEIYSCSDAEEKAQAVSKILPKIMIHVDLIISYLDCHVIEEGSIDLENFVTESLFCLEGIYNLLTIYFRWIEFKNINMPLLKSSLQTVAKVSDDNIRLEDLLTMICKTFQQHEKYLITVSSAKSLMEFVNVLKQLSTKSELSKVLENMALKFLSKQWKALNGQFEKGMFYNQCLDSIIKMYLENVTIDDLRKIVTSLVDEVRNLREKTSILTTLKSVNKSNFTILFRNLETVLCEKIKSRLNGGFTNEELVEMWRTVANILKLMTDIVITLNNKLLSSQFLKKSIPILNLLLSKGFPILQIVFVDHQQTILDMLKDFKTSSDCLRNINSQPSDGVMQKSPTMEELLTRFMYNTKVLLKKNNCTEVLKMFNIRDTPISRNKSKKVGQKFLHLDVSAKEDLDDDFPEDDDPSDDNLDEVNSDTVGISELI